MLTNYPLKLNLSHLVPQCGPTRGWPSHHTNTLQLHVPPPACSNLPQSPCLVSSLSLSFSTHTHTHTPTHTHTHTCTYTHLYIHTYSHTHTPTHTHLYTHTRTHTQPLTPSGCAAIAVIWKAPVKLPLFRNYL